MGSDKQFEALFREYYPRLYYHAYSFLHDQEASHDIVNDTFETLWKNFSHYRDSLNTLPYLYSVVRNKCIDAIRRRMTHKRFVNNDELHISFREEYDYTDYDARLEFIKNRIESLAPQTRIVFMLCHIDGYTYQQAADHLGISVNTVKTTLSRAMKTLREAYAELKPI